MTLYLLDAYAMIYRAYYAFIRTPRINSKGINTSAIFGFTNTLLELLTKRQPDYIAVAFDSHGPTFRHEVFPEYKANRDAQPEDISIAVPYIKELLKAMNIPIVECQGYEADDIIGTLANRHAHEFEKVFMMTPDKDYAQLVNDNILIYRLSTTGAEEWDINRVKEYFGINHTWQIIDLLGLWGDSSDNIPGCPGIGEKKAKELLKNYESIDGIYQHIDELKGKMKENFINHREQVLLSRQLATINSSAPVDFDIQNAKIKEPNWADLQITIDDLEFRNVMPRIKSLFVHQPMQMSLFDTPTTHQKDIATPETEQNTKYDSISTVPHEYICADNTEEIQNMIDYLSQFEIICFDTETTSIEALNAELVGMSFAAEVHKAYYVPMPTDKAETLNRLSMLKCLLEDEKRLLVGQNMKYDIMVLQNYGIFENINASRLFDTMIAHFLLYPSLKHNMDDMAEALLQYKTIHIDSLIGKGKNQLSMRLIPNEEITDYAAEDADITLQLYLKLKEQIENSNEVSKLFYDIEMPLMPVLAEMERTGVRIDTEALKSFALHLKEQIATSEAKIYQLAGKGFNIASPKQVGEVLFEHLKINASAKKTRSGQYSTNEETLQKLTSEHPIVPEILNYRGLIKLLNTYAEALPLLVKPSTGRIHTSFNQTVVVTGRLSSSNPNLQNIPIRDDNGKEIRKAFIASDNDHVILAADYSQVELRIMAHFSQDPHMIEAFKNNEDIHAATAARIYKVPLEEVTKDMRRKAKTANFGIIYGISAFGLAERLDISRKEAKELIDGYFVSFPDVERYMNEAINITRERGYSETLNGRRRDLPDINSRNATVRGVAERNAINAPIQGTAADIIKIAMINISKRLKQESLQTKMILQVHDELIFDTPKSEIEQAKHIIKEEMENAIALSIPLEAEIGIGNNWVDAH